MPPKDPIGPLPNASLSAIDIRLGVWNDRVSGTRSFASLVHPSDYHAAPWSRTRSLTSVDRD